MLLEVRDEFVVDTARHCKKIAESWPSNGVPLLSDVKVGKSWGSMTKLDTAGGLCPGMTITISICVWRVVA
jgi:hypothetical protein